MDNQQFNNFCDIAGITLWNNGQKYRSAISAHKERYHLWDSTQGVVITFDTKEAILKYAIKKHRNFIRDIEEALKNDRRTTDDNRGDA